MTSVRFDWGSGNVATWTVRVDSDGTLHLEPQSAIGPGDVFVNTVHPWTKIADGSDDPVAAGLDGTYRWTLTKDDALTHGLPGDKTPESQATFPWDFTMTMSAGSLAPREPGRRWGIGRWSRVLHRRGWPRRVHRG